MSNPTPFSFSTERIINRQLPCYITYTNATGTIDAKPLTVNLTAADREQLMAFMNTLPETEPGQ